MQVCLDINKKVLMNGSPVFGGYVGCHQNTQNVELGFTAKAALLLLSQLGN